MAPCFERFSRTRRSREIVSIQGGFGAIAAAFEQKYAARVQCSTEILKIEKTEGGFEIATNKGNFSCLSLSTTLPAHVLANLLDGPLPEAPTTVEV